MVTVIGLGFVGLTTALGFSSKGYKVYGLEKNLERLEKIKNNEVPFYEPNLKEALEEYNGKLFFPTSDLAEAIKESQYIFLCVGTPCGENGEADLTYIYEAIRDILKKNDKSDYKVLVVKSTIPPSTTKEKIIPFVEELGFEISKDIGVANNPEFLREGYSWDDFVNPDRIVIGQSDEKSGKLLEKLYKPFGAPVYRVSLNSGEFIKYLSNTLLATLISYSNDMSMIADKIGDIDISSVFKILHLDKRWYGNPANIKSYAYPGCGFGGYCLPKDTQALYSQANIKGHHSSILKSTLDINSSIKDYVVEKISSDVNKDEWLGVLGLSFKSNSDDVRESPSKHIISKLVELGYEKIVAYDPMANENFKNSYELPIKYVGSMEDVLGLANNIVLLTAWGEFLDKKNLLKDKKVYDFRYSL